MLCDVSCLRRDVWIGEQLFVAGLCLFELSEVVRGYGESREKQVVVDVSQDVAQSCRLRQGEGVLCNEIR